MSPTERNYRSLLSLWLELHRKQSKCAECCSPDTQCDAHAPTVAKVAEATQQVLEAS